MTRYVLYGGKGGVGKTTCAAATGLALAERGERTLVVSTDPAHSLGDALGQDLGSEPEAVGPNLWAVETDPESGQATYERIVRALAADFRRAGIHLDEDDVERLFAAGFMPGSDELAALEYLGDEQSEWDVVVLDTAPTGHTLRLLTLPDVLEESLSTAQRLQSDVRRLVDSARSVMMGPAAFLGGANDEEDEIEALADRMERVRALLRDPEQTEFRVVLLPETLAIAETGRLVERLRSFDVPVNSLVVNRVFSSEPDLSSEPGSSTDHDGCERCQSRAAHHEQMVERIRETFPGMSITELPDLGPEATGRDALERIGDQLPA